MRLNIKTNSDGCHFSVSIKIYGQTLAVLTDDDERSIPLQPNLTYKFEWFVVAGKNNAVARVQAEMSPVNAGFPPLDFQKTYSAGELDGNVFLFTTN